MTESPDLTVGAFSWAKKNFRWGVAYVKGMCTFGVSQRSGKLKTTTMKATLTFPTREQAESFAIAYGRFTKRGHIVGAGHVNVMVTVFDLSDSDKEWIDAYVENMNSLISN